MSISGETSKEKKEGIFEKTGGALKAFFEERRSFFKLASSVVFWGSLWGLVEATIGYLLHLVRLQGYRGVTSFFLFPMACYYMNRVRRETSKREPIIYMAVLAAAIKLLDFLIPGHDPIRVLFPAMAIVLEGLAVYGAFILAGYKDRGFGYISALFASLSWRIVFITVQFITLAPKDMPTSQAAVRFLIIDSLVNSILIYLYARLIGAKEEREDKLIKGINPLAAIVTLALSILSKWVI